MSYRIVVPLVEANNIFIGMILWAMAEPYGCGELLIRKERRQEYRI